FRPDHLSAPQALAAARQARATLDDELYIAPFVDIPAWCGERVAYSRRRLAEITGPTLLVNHWPLVVEPTRRMAKPELALWCGTTATRDWPVKHNAVMAIHGHLHIPVETRVDGISHVEVSLGYPFEQHPPHLARPWPFPVMQIS
ncbi:MAG: metallophosphoesterase, partial [Corynebacterium sp.]|nr:metallophosphoesterase [Corynebacterium sp.]